MKPSDIHHPPGLLKLTFIWSPRLSRTNLSSRNSQTSVASYVTSMRSAGWVPSSKGKFFWNLIFPQKIESGKVASYIPQLAKWGLTWIPSFKSTWDHSHISETLISKISPYETQSIFKILIWTIWSPCKSLRFWKLNFDLCLVSGTPRTIGRCLFAQLTGKDSPSETWTPCSQCSLVQRCNNNNNNNNNN